MDSEIRGGGGTISSRLNSIILLYFARERV